MRIWSSAPPSIRWSFACWLVYSIVSGEGQTRPVFPLPQQLCGWWARWPHVSRVVAVLYVINKHRCVSPITALPKSSSTNLVEDCFEYVRSIRPLTPGKILHKKPILPSHHILLPVFPYQAVYLMDREAHVEAHRGVHVRDRVGCLLKAISACYKCDLDASQVKELRHSSSSSLTAATMLSVWGFCTVVCACLHRGFGGNC